MVFVVGKSGCGKSILLNILGGADRHDSGEIVTDFDFGITMHTFGIIPLVSILVLSMVTMLLGLIAYSQPAPVEAIKTQ